jgi:hypothetical protein
MMIIRTLGADALLLLMSVDAPPGEDLSWLLYGPTDDRVVAVDEEPEPLRWAAE